MDNTPGSSIINTQSTESTRYVTLQTLNAISFPTYDLKNSLRFWFKDFEEEIKSAGITNMDQCCIHVARFMPSVIRTFISSINPTVKRSWTSLQEELLLHFGKPVEEENRALLNKLRRCKQRKDESVKLYSAHWKHLCSLLPDKHLTEGQQIQLFSQGIFNDGSRTSLVTYTDVKELDTVEKVIKKACRI